MLGSAEVGEAVELRRQPARVYPRHGDGEQWVVAPPDDPGQRAARTFSGPFALTVALTFAFEEYGSVTHLTR